MHVFSFLERPEGGAVGSWVEGPREGLRAHSRRFYPGAWTDDGSSLRVTSLRIGPPQPVNSLASDEQWGLALELGRATGQLSRGNYADCGEVGDALRPFLQGDLATYSALAGCLRAGRPFRFATLFVAL